MDTVTNKSDYKVLSTPQSILILGCDLGQKVDPTAIALVEQEWRHPASDPKGKQQVHYMARHLERLSLGTSYPDVVEHLKGVVESIYSQARARHKSADIRYLYLDATGVGEPVCDMVRLAFKGTDVYNRIRNVYFVHGEKRTADGREVKLGKAWLVSRMQALLQSGQLHLPDNAEARALAKELLDYEIRVSEDANDRYGAFKTGTHDDLVTALGLAVQETVPLYTVVGFK